MTALGITGDALTLTDIREVAVEYRPVLLSPEVATRVAASRRMVDQYLAEERPVYGVTTGFGRFSDVLIDAHHRRMLQENLLRSHAAGVGPPFPPAVSRAMILLRVNALAKGFSGVRMALVEQLVNFLNRGVTPVVPSQGSVGASGDLAPLAHLALVVMGEGTAWVDGNVRPAGEALARAGLVALPLEAKEGLALINGTQAMTAVGALTAERAEQLADWADIAAALSVEVLRGIPRAYDPKVAAVRPHPGQELVGRHLRHLLRDSRLTTEPGEIRLQDAYSLRCVPQVHGAGRDGLAHVAEVLRREANSVTDNPLLFAESDTVISAGNFHGQPVALVLDYLGIILAEWADISERRVERMVNPALSGLPPFLVAQGGLNSGLMLAQYTAASLVSENKVWAHPASVDSIPTSANQEDHVSMGMTAARKAWTIAQNLEAVLAIELLCAAQAAEFLGPHLLAPRTRAVYRFVRSLVPAWTVDRWLAPDIEAVRAALSSSAARDVARSVLP